MSQINEAKQLLQSWVDQQGHNRCWYYPEIFTKLAALFDIKMTVEPSLPPREEFEAGCRRYQEEEFGAKDIGDEFLITYAKNLECDLTDPEAISRYLCENYHYRSDDREFIMIIMGWIWGKTNDYVIANCETGMLMNKLNKMYAIVAEENNWNDIT